MKFQSTRPRGARRAPKPCPGGAPCFNPRAHAGRDIILNALSFKCWYVSIHAPTRGATLVVHEKRAPQRVSIHAPTRGATTAWSALISHLTFQSTRPRGARRIIRSSITTFAMFQSTRPRGARQFLIM